MLYGRFSKEDFTISNKSTMNNLLKRTIGVICILCCISFSLFSQTEKGEVSGKILDKISNEPLIGAVVAIEGTTIGAVTDFDGVFKIDNLEPGTYNLVCSFVGYSNHIVSDIIVVAGEKQDLIVELEETIMLIPIAVIRSTESIYTHTVGCCGGGLIRRDVRKRLYIPYGDDKFVYMRGLRGRYTNAQLNGSNMPSNDPYGNSFPMNLIPVFMIEEWKVQKNYAPDLLGNFSCGNINIKTKSYPSGFYVNLGFGVKYNDASSFNKSFLSHDGGKTDWLGFGDKSRDIPVLFQEATVQQQLTGNYETTVELDAVTANLADRATKSLNNKMTPIKKTAPLDHSFNFFIGNVGKLFGKQIGFNAGVKYNRSFRHKDHLVSNVFQPATNGTDLPILNQFTAQESIESPELSGIIDVNYNPIRNHAFKMTLLYSHVTDKTTSFYQGQNLKSASIENLIQSRALQFRERAFLSGQIGGKHSLPNLNNIKINWLFNAVSSKQDEPDLRFFANKATVSNGDTTYRLDVNEIGRPAHYFRYLNDDKLEGKFDVEIPIIGYRNTIKIGVNYSKNNRNFEEDQIVYNKSSAPEGLGGFIYNGSPDDYFAESNLGIVNDTTVNGERYYNLGVYTSYYTEDKHSYSGHDQVSAAYAMVDFSLVPNLKISTGFRLEESDIFIAPTRVNYWEVGSANVSNIQVKEMYLLPSFVGNYGLNSKINIGTAFSRTIAKPNMRELAPFPSFDFIGGGYRYIGGLEPINITKINNYDLRFEHYPTSSELFAVSMFMKDFTNPIIKRFSTPSDPREITWENIDKGRIFGTELEIRKSLGFIGAFAENFEVRTNFSYILSEAYDEDNGGINAMEGVPFEGQAPYMFDFVLGYKNQKLGLNTNVNFNVSGDRLDVVGFNSMPGIYEVALPLLNFNVSQRVASLFTVSLSAQNLLNAAFKKIQNYNGKEYIISNYRVGRSYGLSVSFNLR